MSISTPQNLKGFRDFLPAEKRQRLYVSGVINRVFARFGFEPLETPTLEYAELLLGKYGDEADKLVYTFDDKGGRRVGLRYDQTVPTARVLSQYQNDVPRFFRRYQIQNVFRADKPQKGRFREFTQCDADIFGSTSPIADAEILACVDAIFSELGFSQVEIQVNDRQTLLATLEPFATSTVSVFSLIQSVDKLDKLPAAEVVAELVNKGLPESSAQECLAMLEKATPSATLHTILDAAYSLGIANDKLVFNPQLARGLDYYTGMIFEVRSNLYAVGSMGGGGRYDNLIADLGGPNMPAVGFGLGFDRIVEAASALDLIPDQGAAAAVLVTLFEDTTRARSLEVAAALRRANIATEVYPEIDKLGKQFKLADQKQIPFVIIIGQDELQSGQVSLKNMTTGDQETLLLDQALAKIQTAHHAPPIT